MKTRAHVDTVVIGAGPHGLAATAHLRKEGVETRTFGQTMSSWEQNMPAGMLLRSSMRSSHMATPDRSYGIGEFEALQGRRFTTPIPLDDYVEYGKWFQTKVAPDLDTRRVHLVDSGAVGFSVTTDDGEQIEAKRVVVAAGISGFAWRPPEFDDLSSDLASHSFEHASFERFDGRRVAVIGGGPSALESAALLAEAGAEVEVLVRKPAIRWVPREDDAKPAWKRVARKVSSPPTDVGPPLVSWAAAAPGVLRPMPASVRREITRRCLLPTGHDWLRKRLEGHVALTTGARVMSAAHKGGGLELTLDSGRVTHVDHLLLATGYRVDVREYDFLQRIAPDIKTREGFPVLGPGLESSIPGLHFVGAPAAASYGPIMRFVVGTWYTAPALTNRIVGRRVGLPILAY